MKKYIQLTAGWGPAECARAVTLVSSGLLKTFSVVCLIESRPHNMTPCSNIRCSMCTSLIINSIVL